MKDVASFSLVAATADTESVLYKLKIEINLSSGAKHEFNGQENNLVYYKHFYLFCYNYHKFA